MFSTIVIFIQLVVIAKTGKCLYTKFNQPLLVKKNLSPRADAFKNTANYDKLITKFPYINIIRNS